jgi:hypothetical protein
LTNKGINDEHTQNDSNPVGALFLTAMAVSLVD